MDTQVRKSKSDSPLLTRTKIIQIVTGWGVINAINFSYDNFIWLAILVYYGTIQGSILASLAGIMINLLLLYIHIWTKVDWLGVKVFEQLKESGNTHINYIALRVKRWYYWSRLLVKIFTFLPIMFMQIPIFFLRMTIWATKKNDVAAFIALSLYEDSFVTTAFLRHGKKDNLSAKDYLIFFLSGIVGTIYWSFRNIVLLWILKYFYKNLF